MNELQRVAIEREGLCNDQEEVFTNLVVIEELPERKYEPEEMLAGSDVGEHKSGQRGHDRPIENSQWCAGETVWLPDVDEKIHEVDKEDWIYEALKQFFEDKAVESQHGDPICRVCHSPAYVILVAELELGEEIVGLICGCIEFVTWGKKTPTLYAKATYILGFHISPTHRWMGIGLKLVQILKRWFKENDIEYAYMATKMENVTKPCVWFFSDANGSTGFEA
ncbi:hypothetical protein SUGI_0977700 [Cryptomeria japonica]|nr:hypothetical protein SUGI_0977700 [Cryptomeria japonica]